MAIDYNQYKTQASERVDPLYKQAAENVKRQAYTNRLDAGQTAASRGLSHSGLAADLQNKVNIGMTNNLSDLDAQRSAKIAELADQLTQRAQQQENWQSQFDYQKQRDTIGDQRWQTQWDYQKNRDSIGDSRWQSQFDYQKQRDTVGDQRYSDQFNYAKQRDTVSDAKWQNEYDYRQNRDQVSDTRYNDQFNYQKALDEWKRKYQGERDAVADQQYNNDLDLRRRLAQLQGSGQWAPYKF